VQADISKKERSRTADTRFFIAVAKVKFFPNPNNGCLNKYYRHGRGKA